MQVVRTTTSANVADDSSSGAVGVLVPKNGGISPSVSMEEPNTLPVEDTVVADQTAAAADESKNQATASASIQ